MCHSISEKGTAVVMVDRKEVGVSHSGLMFVVSEKEGDLETGVCETVTSESCDGPW